MNETVVSLNRWLPVFSSTDDSIKILPTHLENLTIPQPSPFLPSNKAFIVQFRGQPADAPLSWEGRVEPLTSGPVLRFYASEESLAFL